MKQESEKALTLTGCSSGDGWNNKKNTVKSISDKQASSEPRGNEARGSQNRQKICQAENICIY